MAKMGRPKKEQVKEKSIGVRLSDEQYKRLISYVAEQNLTITQTVQLALDKLFQCE